MRFLFLGLCFVASLCAQTPVRIGIFEGETDVGNPAVKGSTAFDPEGHTYTISGGGANMWANADQFHFVWKKLSGDFSFAATVRFPKPGAVPHRKAGFMVREGLSGDAAYVDAVVHGSGLTELQFREKAGDITHAVRFPIEGPVRIKLERRAGWFTMFAGAEGQPLQELGAYALKLANPVYAGALVCSHDASVLETAVFSDVVFEKIPGAPKKKDE